MRKWTLLLPWSSRLHSYYSDIVLDNEDEIVKGMKMVARKWDGAFEKTNVPFIAEPKGRER